MTHMKTGDLFLIGLLGNIVLSIGMAGIYDSAYVGVAWFGSLLLLSAAIMWSTKNER